MSKKILAILEGPASPRMYGFRQIALVVAGNRYPLLCMSRSSGMNEAHFFQARHYRAGTWESPCPPGSFPLPRPEILSEIFGTKQGELV